MNKNVHIFTGEKYMITRSLKKLEASLGIEYPQMNITVFRTMPKTEDIIEACSSVPFMSPGRLVIIADCTVITSKGSADEAKKISAYLKRLPETTTLALCTEETPDKRRSLFQEIQKNGGVHEFAAPNTPTCIAFAAESAKDKGASISGKAAAELVSIVGCDYYALENETEKLAAFCGYGEIKEQDVRECASKSLDYNIFELHGFLLRGEAKKAQKLLEDILREERPEGVIGLVAKKFRDMFKARSMIDSGYSSAKIAAQLCVSAYSAEMTAKDSKNFSQRELMNALKALADLDYSMKSGEKDIEFALPETLLNIYGLRGMKKDRRSGRDEGLDL